MIKIIRQGMTIKKVECPNCISLLSYSNEDIEVEHGFRFIKCPNCGEDINLDITTSINSID